MEEKARMEEAIRAKIERNRNEIHNWLSADVPL